MTVSEEAWNEKPSLVRLAWLAPLTTVTEEKRPVGGKVRASVGSWLVKSRKE